MRLPLLATAATLTLWASAAAPALAAPPANDAFASARALATLPAEVDGTLAEATRESGEPNHGGTRRERSVWYRFDATETGTFIADTCTTASDTFLAVYSGGANATAPSGLTQVVVNDDACGTGSRVVIRATAGTRYHVAVASVGGAEGAFTLRLAEAAPPENDAFADARRLSRPGLFQGSNVLATNELGEPDHAGVEDGGASVWYRYRAPRTQRITVQTTGSSFDPVLGVYVGDLGSLRTIASNDDGGDSTEALVRINAQRGRTYFIAVASLGRDSSGTFTLGVSDGGAAGVGLTVVPAEEQTLGGVLSRGLRATIGCRVTCRVGVEATLSATSARRLGLRVPRGARRLVLARSGGRIRAGDEIPVVLRLARAAQPRLRRADAVTIALRATLSGTNAADRTVVRTVRLDDEAAE
jgi:hypothetical protein